MTGRKYTIIMVLSFIYGGFLLITYLFMIYSIFWRGEVFGVPPFNSRRFGPERINPIEMITSPLLIFIFVGAMISILSAIAIRSLTHEKEIKKVKADLTSLYLTPEEKHAISELENSGGELTQKELSDRTGYSRVKIHRIMQKLESKKIIRKIPYGQTNKIILNQE